MARSRLLCRIIGHSWTEGRGTEGERFLLCRRCGAVGGHPGRPVAPGL